MPTPSNHLFPRESTPPQPTRAERTAISLREIATEAGDEAVAALLARLASDPTHLGATSKEEVIPIVRYDAESHISRKVLHILLDWSVDTEVIGEFRKIMTGTSYQSS
jgi:hypothetical protein